MGSLRVACIPAHPLLLARLRDAVGAPASVQSFPDTSAALPSILRGDIQCTVVAMEGRGFADSLQTIRVVTNATPSHAVVAWCDRTSLTTRQLLDVAQAGVAEMVLRDVDDLRHVLGRILSSAAQRSHAHRIESRHTGRIPQPLRPIFRFALEQAHATTDVDQVASAFGITRQTLRNRFVQHRMPLPRTFLTWCRLLVAASLLEERGHTLDSVGFQLEFSSGHHLGTVLKRYVGTGVSEMRDSSVVAIVDAAFQAALESTSLAIASSLPEHSASD